MDSKISRRAFLRKASQRAAAVAAASGTLTALTGCPGEKPIVPPDPPIEPKCYPDYLPELNVKPESELGKEDGSIQNLNSQYSVEISTSPNFSSGNFNLAPNQTSPLQASGNYYARWAATGTCPADTKVLDITISKGKEPPPPPLDIESVEPYTEGSYQKWVEDALKPLDPTAEKMRLYNYLLKVHTYLMLHDEHDYIDEYDQQKKTLERELNNPAYDETTKAGWRLALADENWGIQCRYPVEKPFNLTNDETLQTYNYFCDANPQFFINRFPPVLRGSADGRTVIFVIPAYYAFSNRRQEMHKKILNGFDSFKSRLEQSGIDTNNRYDVVKYVYDDVINTLTYDTQSYPSDYVPRETFERRQTILGYFGDSKLSQCAGYARSPQYLLNRLGIPTLLQTGMLLFRDESGNITGGGPHGWNITQMENDEWYFMDTTEDRDGGSRNFLKGQGTGGSLPGEFLYIHEIAGDRIYYECEIDDYQVPVRSMQAPVRQAAYTPVM